MEENLARPTIYFRYCGEVNTEIVLRAAKERHEKGIAYVVIASETGRSALKALEIFKGSNAKIVVVTHYPAITWGPKGDLPIGLMRKDFEEIRQKLLLSGVKIIQGSRPLAPFSRSINWNYPTPEGIMDKTLEIFGAGCKIAIEAAVMATDAGEIEEGKEVISCAGTYKGLDTALVVNPTYSANFFKNFEVREIIAKPRYRVKNLPEYKYENWRGDLDQYY